MLINVAWLHMINITTKVTLVLQILKVLKIQCVLDFSGKSLLERSSQNYFSFVIKLTYCKGKGFEECWKVWPPISKPQPGKYSIAPSKFERKATTKFNEIK